MICNICSHEDKNWVRMEKHKWFEHQIPGKYYNENYRTKYVCRICNKEFNYKKPFMKHEWKEHGIPNEIFNSVWQCPICQNYYSSETQTNNHLFLSHDEENQIAIFIKKYYEPLDPNNLPWKQNSRKKFWRKTLRRKSNIKIIIKQSRKLKRQLYTTAREYFKLSKRRKT